MKKYILSTLILIAASLQTLWAQTVVLYKSNGQSVEYEVADLDSIVFREAVPKLVTSITLNETSITLQPDEMKILTATVLPANADNPAVTWESSNEDVAEVNGRGRVIANGIGTCTITCQATDGSGVYAECSVTVRDFQPVTSITLSPSTVTLELGGTRSLTATVTPSDATNKELTWSSSNTSIATVSTSGMVTAKSAGSCTITAMAADGSGVKATCQVTVTQPVTSITLNKTSLSLSLPNNKTQTLTATVLPTNATNKNVTWASSNTSVVTVSPSGLVTAMAEGTCTVTCTASDGSGVKATCSVTVVDASHGYTNGHEWVDLGFPSGTLWATCNVGASSPEKYGNYYAWGETTTKSRYSSDNCKYCYDNTSVPDRWKKYCLQSEYGYQNMTDGLTELQPVDDAATANWGSGWQMPSLVQCEELTQNSTKEWVTLNGIYGKKFTSKFNGNSIFLPAAGHYQGTNFRNAGSKGEYWTRSLYVSYSGCARLLSFEENNTSIFWEDRYWGFSVRPVCVKGNSSIYVTSIALSESSLTITPNETKKLTATVLPANANNKTVRWESSNASVASVENDGTVKGKAKGTCVIKCSATDGSGKYAECQVTVEEETDGTHGTTDGHEWVDLGLPSGTLWATCNVGANNPEDAGNLYAWGETSTKSTFSWSNYKYCKGTETTLTKYCGDSSYGYNGFTDGKTSLDATDDAASVNWSSKWQMPSIEQAEELQNYTTMENVQVNGKKARKIKSKSNANSILLPADMNDDSGYFGIYWSRSREEGYDGTARGFLISWDDTWIISGGWWYYESMHVRPVRKQ